MKKMLLKIVAAPFFIIIVLAFTPVIWFIEFRDLLDRFDEAWNKKHPMGLRE